MMSSLIRKLYQFKALQPKDDQPDQQHGKSKKDKKKDQKNNNDARDEELLMKQLQDDNYIDDENDAANELVRVYAQKEAEKKSGKVRIVQSMKKEMGENKDNFNFKTLDVLKSWVCGLRMLRARDKLRVNPELR